jgi:undecaprenyl-diphosphatase
VSWIQVVVLAIVQGLTEFLPISSSGHLVLVPAFFEWVDQGLAFDVAVHFGSLVAVCIFFRRDIAGLISGGVQLLGGQRQTIEARMALAIGIGTVPAAAAGLLLAGWIEANLRSPSIIVFTLSGYAILMALADRFGRRERDITHVGIKDALLIGCAQALALVPGTSRSGVTITAARVLGFERQNAARFSFVLSAPVILLATVYKTWEMVTGEAVVPWLQLGIGAAVSAVVAYISIDFFMRFVRRIGLLPFAVYRLLLAAVIVYVFMV